MIERDEWDEAADAWIAAERERLGGPPSPEELGAYMNGELAGPEAARIRALLVYYPELTSLLAEAVPEPADDLLSDVEVARDRAALQARLTADDQQFLHHLLPMAASVIIAVLTALLLQSRFELARLRRESDLPYVHAARHELRTERSRGRATTARPYELPPHETRYMLALILADSHDYGKFRIDIVDLTTDGGKIVWSTPAARPVDGAFELSVPRQFLHAGTYRIDVSGGVSDAPRHLESFWIDVPPLRS